MSKYVATKILNDTFRAGTVYIGLFINDPTWNNTGTEISNTKGYERQEINFNAPIEVTQSGELAMQIVNNNEIMYPMATADYETVSHYGIFDSKTNGNLLEFGRWSKPQDVAEGNNFRILVGAVTINAS